MKVSQALADRKPDVIVRLSPEEAEELRSILEAFARLTNSTYHAARPKMLELMRELVTRGY